MSPVRRGSEVHAANDIVAYVPLRVCLITSEYPPPVSGGVGTYMRDLARALVRAGHDVTVVSSSRGSHSVEREEGVLVVRISVPRQFLDRVRSRVGASSAPLLTRYSLAVRDAVHELEAVHGTFDVAEAALWNAEAALFDVAGPPLVTRLVTPVFKTREIGGQRASRSLEGLERAQCRKSELLAAISRDIGHLVAGHYGLSEANIVDAPLGVPLRPLKKWAPAGPPRLLYVGRMEPRKGTDVLLEALPRILESSPAAQVDIVGQETHQGPQRYEGWSRRLLTAKQQARVRFHGVVSDAELDRLYDQASVFVAPSRYESFGLVYLEAMSRGLPVVGTDIGGISEIVDESVGRRIAPDSPSELASACLELLSDQALQRRLGEAGHARVAERFSDETMARRSVEIYLAARERRTA